MGELSDEQLRIRERKWMKSAEDEDWTNRPFDAYETCLAVEGEKLKGSTVLNIGSGRCGSFEKTAEEKGINAIGFNPNLRKEKAREAFGDKTPAVAGLVQTMPFRDEAFDYELSLGGMPMYLQKEDYLVSFKEVCRTLKKGGQGIFFPLTRKEVSVIEKIISDPSIGSLGCRFIFEEVPDEIAQRYFSAHDQGNYRLAIIKKKEIK